jgi:hypothetical protein
VIPFVPEMYHWFGFTGAMSILPVLIIIAVIENVVRRNTKLRVFLTIFILFLSAVVMWGLAGWLVLKGQPDRDLFFCGAAVVALLGCAPAFLFAVAIRALCTPCRIQPPAPDSTDSPVPDSPSRPTSISDPRHGRIAFKHLGIWSVGFVIMTVLGVRNVTHLVDHSISGYVAVLITFVGMVGMVICGFLRQKQTEVSTSQGQGPFIKPAEIIILAAIIAIIGGIMVLLASVC